MLGLTEGLEPRRAAGAGVLVAALLRKEGKGTATGWGAVKYDGPAKNSPPPMAVAGPTDTFFDGLFAFCDF